MDYPKEIFVKDYFDVHDYYADIYGKNRIIILMQVGSFHEAYSTDILGLDLVNLAQQLDVHCTQKNSKLPLSKNNPRMMGFPIYVTSNFIDKLIDLNYTVILIDQVTDPPNPKRKVTGIYSPATYIDKKTNKQMYLTSIVIDKIKDIKTNISQLCIGVSTYDLSTGVGYIYETYSKPNDGLLALDNTLRFLENYPPQEIILENNLNDTDIINNMKIDNILSYLNIESEKTYKIKIKQHTKIVWQKKLLEQIYNIENNVLETLELEFLNWARLSLILLLEYVQNHQPRLLEQLKKPTLFTSNNYLYLGNRALEQLNISSLFNIINFTKTAIGKRFLHNQLTNPLIDQDQLNTRYDEIEIIMTHNLNNYLEDIYDLEKIVRKLEIGSINPIELYQLYISYCQIVRLINYLKNQKIELFDISEELINNTNKIVNWIENKFIIDKINKLTFNNFTESDVSIYNDSIHEELDSLQEEIDTAQNFMSYLVKELETILIKDDEKKYTKNVSTFNETKSLITLKYNDRDGHYLLITSKRCEMLKKKLEKVEFIKVGSVNVKVPDLEFKELPTSNSTKINCKKIKQISLELTNLKINMAKKIKELFKLDMIKFLNKYKNILYIWSEKIAYIDFINSGSVCAINNHYTKPIINVKEGSYIKIKQMRHPIIERLNTETCYIPHDIELGFETEQNGILLYGINSSGKSSLIKSIAINLILSQVGYYSASSYIEFSPYTSMYTRISSNDNLFKGHSSFMVEMNELHNILKRNNNKCLVVCDEILKSTEEMSANIIITYMLEELCCVNSSFITATHLHKLAHMESVKKLDRIKIKHLKITHDHENDVLIYDRELQDGQGPSFYGLMVSKFLMKDDKFNKRTTEILNEYENNNVIKESRYNSNVIIDHCEICKSCDKLEVHHIIEQQTFDNNKICKNKLHIHKNDQSNLVVLCMKCHDNVDKNLKIIGWEQTTDGRQLNYTINDNISITSKYSDEIINYVKKIQNKVNDEKITKMKIQDKFDIKMSIKTIKNICNDS
jgi:DNA mismatch repair protein MutS